MPTFSFHAVDVLTVESGFSVATLRAFTLFVIFRCFIFSHPFLIIRYWYLKLNSVLSLRAETRCPEITIGGARFTGTDMVGNGAR